MKSVVRIGPKMLQQFHGRIAKEIGGSQAHIIHDPLQGTVVLQRGPAEDVIAREAFTPGEAFRLVTAWYDGYHLAIEDMKNMGESLYRALRH
jgi:hypothetical protein